MINPSPPWKSKIQWETEAICFALLSRSTTHGMCHGKRQKKENEFSVHRRKEEEEWSMQQGFHVELLMGFTTVEATGQLNT